MTMPAIDTWLRQPAAQAVGWALLQFVWQGAAVGALTALALLALRRSASDVRYVVGSIGLALMLTLSVVTGVQKYQTLRSAAASLEETGAVFRDGVVVLPGGDRLRFDRLELLGASHPTRGAAAGAGGASAAAAAIVNRARALRAESLLPA